MMPRSNPKDRSFLLFQWGIRNWCSSGGMCWDYLEPLSCAIDSPNVNERERRREERRGWRGMVAEFERPSDERVRQMDTVSGNRQVVVGTGVRQARRKKLAWHRCADRDGTCRMEKPLQSTVENFVCRTREL